MRKTTHNPSQQNHRSGNYRTKVDLFGIISMFLLLASSLALDIWIMVSKMLPTKYLLLLMIFLLIINAGSVLVQIPLRKNKLGKLICGIVAVLLSAVMIYGMVALGSVQNALAKISGQLQETKLVDVVVAANDPAQAITDARGYQFGILENMDAQTRSTMESDLGSKIGTLQTTSYASVTALADALYAGGIDAIVLDDSFVTMMGELDGYTSFSSDTRILYQFTVTSDIAGGNVNINTAAEPFAVYLSGTDARFNDLSVASRSDVNILAIVNPQSKQVLLLNTPRDYYVPLAVGTSNAYDKLTHAGVYGVDCSKDTLANLYGIEVPFYARVNFDGFRSLVDALGGITVNSEVAFSCQMAADGGDGTLVTFTYQEGPNELNGAQALAFCRERYSFAAGDNQRGRNQMAAIRGIIDKATSPAILAKYQGVLSAVTDCVSTNMNYDDITALVQLTLQGGSGWNITSFAVTGTGDHSDTCYSYPGQSLYVMKIDQTAVSNAKQLISQVMNGDAPNVDALG
jgi:LCP family protein required for cell wall assembly